VGQRLDAVRIQLVHLLDVPEDRPQLAGELIDFAVSQLKTGQLGHLADLFGVDSLRHRQFHPKKKSEADLASLRLLDCKGRSCLAGRFLRRLVVALDGFDDQPHANGLGGDPDATDLAIDDGTDLLDIRLELALVMPVTFLPTPPSRLALPRREMLFPEIVRLPVKQHTLDI
jgi:hypothetical protein